MNTYSTPEETDDNVSSGEELKDALLKSHEIAPSDEKVPVGPFEHSGEVAGWTETEEKQVRSGEGEPQQTNSSTEEDD